MEAFRSFVHTLIDRVFTVFPTDVCIEVRAGEVMGDNFQSVTISVLRRGFVDVYWWPEDSDRRSDVSVSFGSAVERRRWFGKPKREIQWSLRSSRIDMAGAIDPIVAYLKNAAADSRYSRD